MERGRKRANAYRDLKPHNVSLSVGTLLACLCLMRTRSETFAAAWLETITRCTDEGMPFRAADEVAKRAAEKAGEEWDRAHQPPRLSLLRESRP